MGRPTGVTILAILYFIAAAISLLGGIGVISGVTGILARLGAAAGVCIIIVGGIFAFSGFGLWRLKGWARIVSIGLFGTNAVFQLLGLLRPLTHFNAFAVIWYVFWIVVDAFIIWYLLKPEVKAAFQPDPMASTASV